MNVADVKQGKTCVSVITVGFQFTPVYNILKLIW